MDGLPSDAEYPRQLSAQEKEWLEWILPDSRTGYREYRRMIASMEVIGQGRRGPGELILGTRGDTPDFGEPLAPVFAYGAVETDMGTFSITLREIAGGQISVELVSQRAEEVPSEFEESRRWTYSVWNPGSPCPQCGGPVREVPMHSAGAREVEFVLALCPADRRLWVHDASSGVTRPIPPTNFYNELMLHKNIRDPAIALDAKKLFADSLQYSDEDLVRAFLSYNRLRSKVRVEGPVEPVRKRRAGIFGRIRRLFSTGRV